MNDMARHSDDLSKNAPKVSVYLRTDKGAYEAGENLWFKAYLLSTRDLAPSGLDRTLYVQLTDMAKDSTVWQEKYEAKDGLSKGHIYLDTSLKAGDYLLSAYSSRSFYNGPGEFHAVRKIRVIGDLPQKENRGEEVVGTKTVEKKTGEIRFHTFPEGGNPIYGVKNRLAFKAVDGTGFPVEVSGVLYEGNRPIMDIKSEHAGMGSFLFAPKKDKTYHIELVSPAGDSLYPLPRAHHHGMALQLIARDKEKMVFRVFQAPGGKGQRIYLMARTRGRVPNMATGILRDSLDIALPTKDLPQGIVETTLFDSGLRPMAERLVYVGLEKKLYIKTEMDKRIYGTREKVSLKISTTDKNGNPVPARLGIGVHDRSYRNAGDPKDIMTHYHLSTQLRGRIYGPGYYFDDTNKNRERALDLLLLTQGWRRYVWNGDDLREEERNTSAHIVTDYLQGRVVSLKKKKNVPPQQVVAVYDPLKKKGQRFVLLDSLGRFALAPDELKMGKTLYIKHYGTKKEKVRVEIRDAFMDIDKAKKKKKALYPFTKTTDGKSREISLDLSVPGNIDLEEVQVIGKKGRSVQGQVPWTVRQFGQT